MGLSRVFRCSLVQARSLPFIHNTTLDPPLLDYNGVPLRRYRLEQVNIAAKSTMQ